MAQKKTGADTKAATVSTDLFEIKPIEERTIRRGGESQYAPILQTLRETPVGEWRRVTFADERQARSAYAWIREQLKRDPELDLNVSKSKNFLEISRA